MAEMRGDRSGVELDIVTLRPKAEVLQAQKEEADRRAEVLLEKQAAWRGVTDTESGRLLIQLVQEKLQARIEKLVADDPESKAYESVLKEMGGKLTVAHNAAQKLADRYLQKKKE